MANSSATSFNTLEHKTLTYASSFMRRVICYNQGEYAQYNFLAGELHKRVKDLLRQPSVDVRDLHKRFDQLEDFLNRNLYRVSQRNFKYIKQYFSGRHDVEPRICIKGNYERDGKEYIVQVIRDKDVSYPSDRPLDDSSAFLSVKNTGRQFICNDIPRRIATDEQYHNARIDTQLARAYYKERGSRAPTALRQGFPFDESWVKCWKRPTRGSVLSTVDPTSCYKSTVIIPMTLWNNYLDPSFLKMMSSKAQAAEVSRTIFGYLCFDHVETHYFDETLDIDVGYIFADILSQYMITRSIYTKLSETFSKALKSFSEEEVVTGT